MLRHCNFIRLITVDALGLSGRTVTSRENYKFSLLITNSKQRVKFKGPS